MRSQPKPGNASRPLAVSSVGRAIWLAPCSVSPRLVAEDRPHPGAQAPSPTAEPSLSGVITDQRDSDLSALEAATGTGAAP